MSVCLIRGTHIHTLSHTVRHTHTHALSDTHTLTHCQTHTHTLAHCQTHTHTHSHTVRHTPSHALARTLSHTHTLAHCETHRVSVKPFLGRKSCVRHSLAGHSTPPTIYRRQIRPPPLPSYLLHVPSHTHTHT